ncbi:uncharacterized protein DSM5745_00511 [Aspergillus mulundensis]|uniref:Uncharacterized protein n=1 Tax=Aspergillus mulundensis TaxID=1810919 RepID=A0A3D8T3T9_9EURO|nr:hypothetical protein DSM5745_00511 [Aspergillus mulundensis]RDW93189.1 hypothetical protein DSM5745_00511 [Aspergillus mulundensis]
MTRPRRNWTAEEDMILREEVEKAQAARNTTVNWTEIARQVPGRTNKDCRKRWHGTTSAKVNKGPWTEDEDERLRNAVQKHGPKWTAVASVVGTRLPDQCSKRWSHAIKPEIDHGPWAVQEVCTAYVVDHIYEANREQDKLLIESVQKYGHSWQQIVSLFFPRRTSLSAKNRFHLLQRRSQHYCRRARTPSSGASDFKPSISGYESGDGNELAWMKLPDTISGCLGEDLLDMDMDEPGGLPEAAAEPPSKTSDPLWMTPFSQSELSSDTMGMLDFPFLQNGTGFRTNDVSITLTSSDLDDHSDPFSLTLANNPKEQKQELSPDDLTPYLGLDQSAPSTTLPTPPSALSSVRQPQAQRRVTIHAVCSSDNLGAIFQAVTKLSVSAVFKTDEQGSF